MSLGYPVLSYLNWLVFARLPISVHEERALITACRLILQFRGIGNNNHDGLAQWYYSGTASENTDQTSQSYVFTSRLLWSSLLRLMMTLSNSAADRSLEGEIT
jgi:hypothetical protein